MAEEHICLIPDENFNCTVCGSPIPVPEVEPPDLGDIIGITKLIDATASNYAKLVKANTDPNNPLLPRFRMVGGQIVRIPHRALLRSLSQPTYKAAKKLGYRGTFIRWQELLQEATTPL